MIKAKQLDNEIQESLNKVNNLNSIESVYDENGNITQYIEKSPAFTKTIDFTIDDGVETIEYANGLVTTRSLASSNIELEHK